jgi:hypothetical protein
MNMHKEQCTMHKAPCTRRGMKTRRAPGGRLGHVARWAAVAAVAAGAWLEFARDAEAAVTAYYRNESDSGGYWYYG